MQLSEIKLTIKSHVVSLNSKLRQTTRFVRLMAFAHCRWWFPV